MRQFDPIAKDLVLVGGGHSHVILLRMLGMNPMPGLQVTLISPDAKTPYSGMLPGVIAGHYQPEDIHIDLVPLCRFAGARFIQARVTDIDPYDQRVILNDGLDDRPDIHYDVLSLNSGITPELQDEAMADRVIAVKPIGAFLDRWDGFMQRLTAGRVKRIAVVGSGAGGVELGLAIRQKMLASPMEPATLNLVTADASILATYPTEVQESLHRHLRQRGIKLNLTYKVDRVTKNGLESDSNESLAFDEIFWVTHAASQSWLAKTGINLDAKGFVQVKPTLQTTNFTNIFAAGDMANVVDHPRPKAGVYAVRQGPVLYRNISRLLLGKKPRPFKPQKDFLSILTTGDKYAVATKFGVILEGHWVWRWKNMIDQRFMNRFRHLPRMQGPKLIGLQAGFDDQMRCGGCGSKVSAEILSDVLREAGIASDQLDDAAVFEPPANKLMLHSVDSFKAFLDDPYEFAQIGVEHALSDIYAMGGNPKTALAMMTLPYASASKTRGNLQQLIAGTLRALKRASVELVGGHTTEGAELSLGFSINGVVSNEQIMRKQWLKKGDLLVLTKPIGSGVIFAADMQLQASGDWVNSALKQMKQSNREASEIFVKQGVKACTDITGFGLAGHLLEMLRASRATAVISLDSVKAMEGALILLAKGIRSTLHDGNKAACVEVQRFQHPVFELMFDPQTAGGLLAGVEAEKLENVMQALKAAGYEDASVIGRVVEQGVLATTDVHLAFENQPAASYSSRA